MRESASEPTQCRDRAHNEPGIDFARERDGAMPLSPPLAEQSFDAAQSCAIGLAFHEACQSLRLNEAPDLITDIIANKIIEAARAGEFDLVRLYEAVMHWAAAD